MKRVAQGKEIQNRCNEFNTYAFCLYNKYFKKYVIFNATLIKEGSFYMIIYSNITSQIILNKQLDIINDDIQSQLSQSQYTLLISGLTLLLLAVFIIHYIFLPLKDLMKTLYFYIKQRGNNINKEIFKLFNTKMKVKSNNTFSDLMQVFLKFEAKMNLSQQIKNKDCIFFEQIQYQKQAKNELINPLEVNLNSITNNPLTFSSIKNIFDLLKLKLFNL
ncbi:unnamed protein product [Paramecium sonneborni]|nr:unnamed protein product [Paramecium sonneborni]